MLDGHDSHQSVTNVFTIKIILVVLEKIQFSGVLVHDTGQCRLKSGHQRPPVCHIDTVTVCIDLFPVILGVLECHFHFDISTFPFNINNILMKRHRIPVDITDITLDSKLF